jgi:hypothetical protein
MAAYEFRTEDGEVVEVFLSFAEHSRRVKNDTITLDDGRKAKTVWDRSVSSRHRAVGTNPGNWPQVCGAAGVHPDQVPEHIAHLKSLGCGYVEHTKDGDPIFNDIHQRKRALEGLGLFDRNGGYTCAQPKHVTRCRKFR